jgi:signal transduction histidine kinase
MLRGKTILKVVEKSERRPDAWEELVDAVAHRRPFRGVECKLQSPHGELYLRATGAPKTSRDGRFAGYFGASSDITQYVIDSKILREAGTAKAVGTLAAGMAHDFNNLLVPIVGFSEGLIDDLAGNEAACARLRAIHEAALHGRELIARLMRYSRGAGGTSLDCEAGDVVRKIIDIVRPICPSAIKLETSLPAEAMRLRCDALELEQCVINLVNNAVDAIGVKRGNVLIELSSAAGSGSQRWARLCVRDDGAGMTEEVRRRCLQPFFTTKDAGKGTGLGLAMVGALVRRRGGRIEIDSAPGAGTSITLVLPIADPPRGGA